MKPENSRALAAVIGACAVLTAGAVAFGASGGPSAVAGAPTLSPDLESRLSEVVDVDSLALLATSDRQTVYAAKGVLDPSAPNCVVLAYSDGVGGADCDAAGIDRKVRPGVSNRIMNDGTQLLAIRAGEGGVATVDGETYRPEGGVILLDLPRGVGSVKLVASDGTEHDIPVGLPESFSP